MGLKIMEDTKDTTENTKEPVLSPGDLVRVNVKVKEGGKERVQAFEGTVIALKGKKGSQMFTVRKIATGGIGVERIWPMRSPAIESVKVLKKRPQKRAKLYYLRNLSGKEATGAKL